MTFTEDTAIAFAIYCDENRLSMTEGQQLAIAIGAACEDAAEDRRAVLRDIAPELLDDEGEGE